MKNQGLSFVALAVRTAGRMVQHRRAGSWIAISCTIFGVTCFTATCQEQSLQTSPFQEEVSIPAQRLEQIQSRVQRSFLQYTLSEQMMDQFDSRSIQFYFLSEYRRGEDTMALREAFGRSARRRVERSITRTATRALERTEFVTQLKSEPWKERIFNMAKDSFTEEMPTLGTPIGDDDPYVDYDVESPVMQKPAWKEKVNFFVRPFSLHPNVGVGFKLDSLRSQIKLYHDQIKFSAAIAITETWDFYSSARMKDFTTDDTTFSLGFQNEICFLQGADPAIIQYGISIKNRSWAEERRKYDFYFVPHLFFAVGFQY